MTEVQAAALAWHDQGYCVLPAARDGSKRPALAWQQYQHQRPDRATVEQWFADPRQTGLGIICGAASGGLEMLELEGRAVEAGAVEDIKLLVEHANLVDLWLRVTATGYVERTPSGGVHILYRLADAPVPGNTKLARRPATPDELRDNPREKTKVLAETRGEGGWTVTAPSNGSTHPTGQPWSITYGHAGHIPTITVDEREQLHRVFRALDRTPPPAAPAPSRPLQAVPVEGAVSPGDDFEARTDWADQQLLGGAGWRILGRRGDRLSWLRPGKETPGISATTGGAADGRDRLYVFSSATDFPTEQPMTKFGAYAVLHHGGDHSAAARALRKAGYGSPLPSQAEQQAAAIAELVPGARLAAVDGTAARVIAEPLPEPRWYGATQDGLARALVAHHGHQLRYCPQRGRWLYWTGHRWLWDEAERHRELIRALARGLPDEDGWRKFRASALTANGVAGVARLAQSDAAITVHQATLDARPYELNTPAGIIDLRTGQLLPPDPAAMHTRSTTVAPDFDRPSDLFNAFLADTFTDPELSAYVQRLLGVSAIGTVLEQLFLFAHGTGANGKSTLLEAAMHALGTGETGYAMAAPAEMLMVRRHAEHPAELAQLAGARLVVCSELDDGQRFAEARVKQLTGRDSINARFMRRDPFTFTPSHTLWLLGNHKPAARTGGPAFWRRVRLLPFTQAVSDDRRDPHLGEKLAQEAAAILAWMARGAADYQQGRLREPESVLAATRAYQEDQDTVTRFVEESCHLAPGSPQVRVYRDELRTAYERWCHENGDEEVSAKEFAAQIRLRSGDDGKGKTGGRRYYAGICLLQAEDAGSDPDEARGEWYR
jgi:putative DNA primase/helicase